jgi:hypothetical protein
MLKSSLDNIANLKKLGKDFWVVLNLNENQSKSAVLSPCFCSGLIYR